MSIFDRLPSFGGPQRKPGDPITFRDVQEMRAIFVNVSGALATIEAQFGTMQDVLSRPIPPGFTIPSEEVAGTHQQLAQAIGQMREMINTSRVIFDNGVQKFTAMEGRN